MNQSIAQMEIAYQEWEEYIEMYPGSEWAILAHVLGHKLSKQLEETEYYKRMADVTRRGS